MWERRSKRRSGESRGVMMRAPRLAAARLFQRAAPRRDALAEAFLLPPPPAYPRAHASLPRSHSPPPPPSSLTSTFSSLLAFRLVLQPRKPRPPAMSLTRDAKQLRACLGCLFVQSGNDFLQKGCPNCDQVLQVRGPFAPLPTPRRSADACPSARAAAAGQGGHPGLHDVAV
jgi:hypothetical protein